jgi:hypothetical protein
MLFKSPDGEVVKVKVGFSWQAFFVGSLRALLKRTWVLIGLGAVVYFMLAWAGPASLAASSSNVALLLALLALYLGYMMFCGLYGNRWLVSSLLRRGFRKVGEEKR